MDETEIALPWTVLLIGGSSGVGKTIAARQLARDLGIPHRQGDDFRLALNRTTTAADHPALHFFTADRAVWQLPPKRLADGLAEVAAVVSHALEAVLAHHLDLRAPVILEGDVLLPTLTVQPELMGIPAADQVRAVFLHEADEAALGEAMRARGRRFELGTPDEQRAWVRMSWLYGNWLRAEAERVGVPVIPARPWQTLPARILAAGAS